MNPVIKEYVDQCLDFATRYRTYLMYENEAVEPAMAVAFDEAVLQNKPQTLILDHAEEDGMYLNLIRENDHLWQAIDSSVTDADIKTIEQHYGIRLPDSYKEYLKYKHFYTIFINPDIKLCAHPVNSWKDILCYENDEMREDLLEQGYFSIGKFSDHSEICFALKSPTDNYKVVVIDYECGVPEGEEEDELGENFIDFLANTLQQGEGIVRELKDWEKRLHK